MAITTAVVVTAAVVTTSDVEATYVSMMIQQLLYYFILSYIFWLPSLRASVWLVNGSSLTEILS